MGGQGTPLPIHYASRGGGGSVCTLCVYKFNGNHFSKSEFFSLLVMKHHAHNNIFFLCVVFFCSQVGTVLDTVEQLVEEQAMDPLSSDKKVSFLFLEKKCI